MEQHVTKLHLYYCLLYVADLNMMNNRNIENLPPLVLQNVLLRLSGDDLKSCRLVNKKMNNFISSEIWGRKANKGSL